MRQDSEVIAVTQNNNCWDSAFERLRMELERPPFNRWLAPEAVHADQDAGEIEIALDYRPEYSHHPSEAIFHGGVLSALVDIAGHAAVAVLHRAPAPTINLQIDYLAPARGAQIRARGFIRKLGRSMARADVEIEADGKLVALGRGTFSTRRT